MNLPNKLSLMRIALAFLFMALFLMGSLWARVLSLVVFIIAALTDLMDGHLARKQKLVTNLGKLLDPLADKVLMTTAFVSFVQLNLVPGWMVMLIISREFCVTGLRLIASAKGQILAASKWGKQKTISQVVVVLVILVLLLILDFNAQYGFMENRVGIFQHLFHLMIHGGMWVTLALTLFSGGMYVYDNLNVLSED